MTTDYKVTELFCIIDEFCKHFDAEIAGNLLEDNSGTKRRRRQASLSDSEIMTILLYFHFCTFRNFKHYYLFFIKGTMKSYFPKAACSSSSCSSLIWGGGRCTGITFVDSTITAQIVHSRHRSVSNFIMNLISALGAYCFFDNKPKALQGYCIVDTKQLTLF